MRCSCFGGPSVNRKKGTAAGTLHGIDGDLLQDINHLSYNELRSATDNFHTSNKIGRGGFGTVYKVGILRSGTQVAVKTLSAQSKQGVPEFLNEIKTISKVKHPNLVELIGCCAQGTNRILVYEYVENNSLDRALLGSTSTDIKLDWGRRSAICLGIARGLDFLHKEVMISPISAQELLEQPGVSLFDHSDFGPVVSGKPDKHHLVLFFSFLCSGYLAPEYAMGGQLTMKADVYSFGVLILEIISGRSSSKPSSGGTQKLLLEWAWTLHEEGKPLELVDPEMGEFPGEEVIRYIKVAFFCTQSAANRRPRMIQVVDMLSKQIQLNDNQLTAPGFFQDSDNPSGGASSTKNFNATSNGNQMSSVPVKITEDGKLPRLRFN
ncbi:hypothetical protein DKX38_017073 [Salix brachista]|uniref:Protein kinase domain-containing protein n=1 Tax=Salix brachista TaxID=2182728 RepID=A0A5N5KU91_9ROSI|nr:hypothetical protein DKX38_017073 [Salix brachista]